MTSDNASANAPFYVDSTVWIEDEWTYMAEARRMEFPDGDHVLRVLALKRRATGSSEPWVTVSMHQVAEALPSGAHFIDNIDIYPEDEPDWPDDGDGERPREWIEPDWPEDFDDRQ